MFMVPIIIDYQNLFPIILSVKVVATLSRSFPYFRWFSGSIAKGPILYHNLHFLGLCYLLFCLCHYNYVSTFGKFR